MFKEKKLVFRILFLILLSSNLVRVAWGNEKENFADTMILPNKARILTAPQIQSVRDNLDSYLEKTLNLARIPGLSAAIVKKGEIAWTGAYGWSRLNDQPVTSETLFQLASVSKTVTAVAVMSVWEKGDVDLDEDINIYLPFTVLNPAASEKPITIRMLLTHTSTVLDNWEVLDSVYVWDYDSDVSLGSFLEDYFTPDGKYYSSLNFYNEEPGKTFQYSNVGIALAAYLVEVITGLPFDRYCYLEIFNPLGMEETSWRLGELDPSHIAMPYHKKHISFFTFPPFPHGIDNLFGTVAVSQSGSPRAVFNYYSYHPYGFYAYPDYPDGLLKTSARQLANFLNMFIQFGEINGIKILQRETIEEMRRVQNPEVDAQQGLVWHYKKLGGWKLFGHSGEDLGVATEMYFRPEDDVGVILLMNGDRSHINERLIKEMEIRLFTEAATL